MLCLVVVLTTLFITKPTIFIGPKHLGYDFSYTYHAPTRKGGTVTVGLFGFLQTLAPYSAVYFRPDQERYLGLWNTCIVQLPDTSLRLADGYKPDQCTEVPAVANGDESPDYTSTILHIDPRAVWSDGTPITAADYLFTYHLLADPNISGGGPPWSQMRVTEPDQRSVRIDWSVAYGDYLGVVASLIPLPLHALATGPFAGVFVPETDTYDSALAHQLVGSAAFNVAIPVDSGPFTVQSFDPASGRAVLVRNPHFFSNFFHAPALDGVTVFTVNPQYPHGPSKAESVATLVAAYRQGVVDIVDSLDPLDLRQVGAIPKAQVQTSPNMSWLDIEFNQRTVAPNAQTNGGASIFTNQDVRKAFVEAFDRCAAVRAQLGINNCADPNLFTNELSTAPAPDYDPSVTLPGYNPTDAARLLDQAGYPVMNGIRRARDGKTPLRLTIDVSHGAAEAPLIGQRMQQDYARNLQVGVTLVSADDFFNPGDFTDANTAARGDFDICLTSFTGSMDPVFNTDLPSGPMDTADIPSAQNPGGYNYLGIVDPLVVQQERLGSETLDGDQRALVYRQVKRHTAQAFYAEPVFIVADVALVKPMLCNFKMWPSFGVNTWNMADWYVAPSCP